MSFDDNYILKLEKVLIQIKKYQKAMLKSQGIDLTLDQWILIKHINDDEHISQINLAKQTGKDPASIKRILDILEANEYVLRNKSAESQRIHSLSLTEKGNAVIHKMFPVTIDFEAKGVEGISNEEMEIFNSVIAKLKSNFEF